MRSSIRYDALLLVAEALDGESHGLARTQINWVWLLGSLGTVTIIVRVLPF